MHSAMYGFGVERGCLEVDSVPTLCGLGGYDFSDCAAPRLLFNRGGDEETYLCIVVVRIANIPSLGTIEYPNLDEFSERLPPSFRKTMLRLFPKI